MQKRKERKGPFFHEYIVIRLDNGEFYRIDRRPYQKVGCSMYSAKSKGFSALDTLEQTSSFEYSPDYPGESSPLLDIEFQVPVQLQLILHILRAVHAHPKARDYTVHLYNCYFFSRVIVYCITRSVREKHQKDLKGIEFPFADKYWKSVIPDPQVDNPAKQNFARIEGASFYFQEVLLRQSGYSIVRKDENEAAKKERAPGGWLDTLQMAV
ncbi:hypothetical protein OPQ81_007368 [Rhizoctonia solani]|nr:hypothetical protein OPQ81_007368 [Rhizoctonia solani]